MSEKMADDFLMSPMVDYCFKELLAYPTVRKGFLAAILNRDPSEIGSTELLPTILEKETEEGKYGILDVRIRMKDGSQIDLEMQVVSEQNVYGADQSRRKLRGNEEMHTCEYSELYSFSRGSDLFP